MRLAFFALVAMGIFFVVAIPMLLMLVSIASVVMPWLCLGIVVWAICAAGRPSRRRQWVHHGWQPRSMPSPRRSFSTPPQPRAVLSQRQELPIDVQVMVEQIRRKVEVLLGYATRFPPFSQDLYIVRQTASDYLPRTLDAYQALPPSSRDSIVTTNGKTALQELKDQLALLDHKLDEIADNLQNRDLDRLLANRRFLEDRFGRTSA